jgi:hypothetical protein
MAGNLRARWLRLLHHQLYEHAPVSLSPSAHYLASAGSDSTASQAAATVNRGLTPNFMKHTESTSKLRILNFP